MHQNSKLMFREYGLEFFRSRMRVLEIGPDEVPTPYQLIVDDRTLVWHTLDVADNPRLRYPRSAPYSFPIADDSYDIVLSGQVLEHVPRIWHWIEELSRVCVPGGFVITINPVSWPYHEAPVDCWRVYPEGMKALYDEAGLNVVLSTWGSLEIPNYRTYLPGRSPEFQGRWLRVWRPFQRLLRLPVERAYDTVTVGRKKLSTK